MVIRAAWLREYGPVQKLWTLFEKVPKRIRWVAGRSFFEIARLSLSNLFL
jgi:hypothetical protein